MVSLPLLYLIYGTFTQFLILILITGIPVFIYTYRSINNIEKLYPELTPRKKEIIINNIKYFRHYKNELKKHFGNAIYAFTSKKQLNELNIVLNFHKFIGDYDKYMQYEDIMEKTSYYMKESTRSNDDVDELDKKKFNQYRYDNAREDIDFDKLKEILKENNIPIINYIHSCKTISDLSANYSNRDRFKVKLKNNIFY